MQLKIVFWVYNYVLRAMFDIRQDKYDNSLEFHLHSHSNKIYLKYEAILALKIIVIHSIGNFLSFQEIPTFFL